jgi:dolichyldiphosphatase
MGYFTAFCACHLYFHHRFSPSGLAAFDYAFRLCAYGGLFTWAGAVAYSR